MARVDFYLLPQPGEDARQRFACRLAEKAWKLDNTVHIHVADGNAAARLDELLWTFRDGSFVPHEIEGQGATEAPVTIGSTTPGSTRDLLINLDQSVPEFAATFPRVAELVTSDDDSKRRSRSRFVHYRDQGHTLETHNL